MLFVTRKPHRYAGGKRVEGTRRRQDYVFGDEFEVHRNDMGLVKTLGWGVPAEEAKPAPRAAAKKAPAAKKAAAVEVIAEVAPAPAPTAEPAAAATAEPVTAPTPAPTAAPRGAVEPARGTYLRRDLVAESPRDD